MSDASKIDDSGAAVKVKPLRWNRSTVFGEFKWRGMCPAFGTEFTCFMQRDLTLEQQQAKKDAAQADYEARIRSALVAAPRKDAVKGEPEPVESNRPDRWVMIWTDCTGTLYRASWVPPKGMPHPDCKLTPLYTAPPADAGMREALEQIRIACIDNAGEIVRHDLALKFVGSVAAKALTAPGATTKSDGGLTPNATTIAAIRELERGGGKVIGGPSPIPFTGYGEFTPGTVRGVTSDPSSTRSDVTVDVLAAFIGALDPDSDAVARALLDQFEIRRK